MSAALLTQSCLLPVRQQSTVRHCRAQPALCTARCTSLRLGHRQRQTGLWKTKPARQVTSMGLFGLGIPELAIIAGVATLLFGPSKLPGLGKELGKTVKSFQGAAKEFESELKKATEDAKTLPEDDNKRQ